MGNFVDREWGISGIVVSNRQANAALYRAVIVRMRWHEPTILYVKKRTADGLSKRDIIRCLKCYLVREVYRLLPPPTVSNLA